MNCRHTDKQQAGQQQGIALVITLVMLAVVTVMAIVFLAVTRRERSSVIVTQETAVAKDMADAALERAKTEAMAKMNASGSRLSYDTFNSTVYYRQGAGANADFPLGGVGFTPGLISPTNVAHPVWWRNLSRPDYLRNLANLQHDPAVPVYVETNRNQSDFRFFLDFNRNRHYETNYVGNGWALGRGGITNEFGRFVGDPEWIGVLERPDFPHSETNRFVGRMAYLVVPAGKTLDLNFMHNQVRQGGNFTDLKSGGNGFSRSQGVGSWEINLAAFFRELNTNVYAWPDNTYDFTLGTGGFFDATGFAFDDARSLLAYRLLDRDGQSTQDNLDSIYNSLGLYNLYTPNIPQADFNRIYPQNFVEEFSRRPNLGLGGQVFYPPTPLPGEALRDDAQIPGWPGSVNTNAFTDIQQLFSVEASSPGFVARLTNAAVQGAVGNSGRSSYDRYTFYRLLSQLGTDSSPALDGKIHLNFKNPIGIVTNVTERWTDDPTNAIMFFTNAADLLLKASIDGTIVISNRQQELSYQRPMFNGQATPYYIIGDTLVRTNFSMTNIQVYATNSRLPGIVINEYTPTVHRILQVTANIYDAMTNREARLPSVFMPVFAKTPTNIIVNAYVEVGGRGETNSAEGFLARPWTDAESAFSNTVYQVNQPLSGVNLYGQHMLIGAKKGHPNFNELALNSRVEFSRKVSFTKESQASTNMIATNQMFLIGLEQRWGMEAWNSYTSTYPRRVTISGEIVSTVSLRDSTNNFDLPIYLHTTNMFANVSSNDWRGRAIIGQDRNMLTLIDQTKPHIQERSYTTGNGTLFGPNRLRGTNDTDYISLLELPPQLILFTTNKVRYWIKDENTGRLIDFISYDRLVTQMDLREQLREDQSLAGGTNANRISYWDTNRIGNGPMTVGISNQIAVSVGEMNEPQWRAYRYNSPDKVGSISKFRAWMGLPLRTGIDTNINPSAVSQSLRHQVPYTPTRQMVQRLSWQVNDPLVHYMMEDLRLDLANARLQVFDNVDDRVVNRTNQWNIGLRNIPWYHPWSGADDLKQDRFSWNVGLMDPGVRSSDHWEFQPAISNFNHFPNIGMLGQVHRGTPWQTLYLKSFYMTNGQGEIELFTHPSLWYDWAGSMGTHPTRDWPLLDVFTTALNENAARGLLSVNQTNTAAWSAVLSGTIAATNTTRHNVAVQNRTRGVDPTTAYSPWVIEPGTPQIAQIVNSINHARTNQFDIIRNPDPNANRNMPYVPILRTNTLANRRADVFRTMGEIVSAPGLSVQSPFLNRSGAQVQAVWTDKAVEYIPQQILSLVQRDEPRFVVYSFGQSLKPAPRSLTTDPSFYHMCTNYQITGEVITKTTFRVEGQPRNPQNPLRPVVEKYEILPPFE